MNDVLAIVVTYNRKNMLHECLSALLLQTIPCDILIIDNASTDGTNDMINNEFNFKNIIYHNTGKNVGGAGGYNIGLKKACAINGYRYFWLMDDDCIVNDDSLEKILDADEKLNCRWGFLSSKVLWKDGSICKTNVQRKKVAKKINDFTSELVNVDYASFVSLFIKKEDVLKVGLPIKDFYIWTDDLEYTRRLTMNVGKGYLVNESIVIHKCKENIGVDISKDSIDRLDRYRYIYRNDVYTFKREGISGWMFLLSRYIYHIIKIILSFNDIVCKIKIMTKGYIDGMSFNPIVEYVDK